MDSPIDPVLAIIVFVAECVLFVTGALLPGIYSKAPARLRKLILGAVALFCLAIVGLGVGLWIFEFKVLVKYLLFLTAFVAPAALICTAILLVFGYALKVLVRKSRSAGRSETAG